MKMRRPWPVPDLFEAKLTFGGEEGTPFVEGTPVVYRTTGLVPGQPLHFVLQADASNLPTGHHKARVDITSHFGRDSPPAMPQLPRRAWFAPARSGTPETPPTGR